MIQITLGGVASSDPNQGTSSVLGKQANQEQDGGPAVEGRKCIQKKKEGTTEGLGQEGLQMPTCILLSFCRKPA